MPVPFQHERCCVYRRAAMFSLDEKEKNLLQLTVKKIETSCHACHSQSFVLLWDDAAPLPPYWEDGLCWFVKTEIPKIMLLYFHSPSPLSTQALSLTFSQCLAAVHASVLFFMFSFLCSLFLFLNFFFYHFLVAFCLPVAFFFFLFFFSFLFFLLSFPPFLIVFRWLLGGGE